MTLAISNRDEAATGSLMINGASGFGLPVGGKSELIWMEKPCDLSGWASLSSDGSTVAIGAPKLRRGELAMFAFTSATLSKAWEQVGADIDGEARDDRSGWSVSLSADGNTVAISSIFNDGNGRDSGHVRIYQRNIKSNTWEQVGADIDGEAFLISLE